MQLALVIIAVALAGLYLARGVWRTGTGGCTGCGPKPDTTPPLVSPNELTARLRAKTHS
jgi:hypothetical protein